MTLPSDSPSTAPVSAPTPTPAPAFAVDTSAAAEEFIEEASGQDDPPPLVRGTPRRLLGWIVPANFSVFMIWGAVGGLLMPLQVQLLGEEDKVANLAVVGTFGALAALLAQPVAGQISDRTRSRFGRRAPWLVLGALVGGLGLLAMGFASSLVGIVIGWMIVQIAYNFAQGPLSAIMPDRVPRTLRGTFAALSGLGLMLGALGGSILGAQFADSIQLGYLVFAGFTLIVLTLFVVFNPDHSSKDLAKEPFDIGEFLRTFWVSPRKHPDFGWAFFGRFFMYLGYQGVVAYQLYILRDYIGQSDTQSNITIGLMSTIQLVTLILSSVVSGYLSDKFQARKPFVLISSVIMAASYVVPLVWRTETGMLVMAAVLGLGYGCYMSIDMALMTQVLPNEGANAGKDMGVLTIATNLPQMLTQPLVAILLVISSGSYVIIFVWAIILVFSSAFMVMPIKSVK